MGMGSGVFIRTRLCDSFVRQACAFARMQNWRISPGYALKVATIEAQARERQMHFPVKPQFLRNNPKCGSAVCRALPEVASGFVMQAPNDRFENIVLCGANGFWQVCRTFCSRIVPPFGFLPSEALRYRLLLFKRNKLLCLCFAVSIRAHVRREKLAICIHPPLGIRVRHRAHVLNNFLLEQAIRFFGVLFV